MNRNLLIAGICAFFVSAVVVQIYDIFDDNAVTNSLVGLVTEYAVYIPVFAVLFYNDNRHKYADAAGTRDSKKIWCDAKKLIASFSVSEIIYSVTRGYAHYQILVSGTEPYQASMLASITAWAVFFICVNLGVKLTHLFSKTE
ncbi:MAG: hypothetical protein QXU32_06315 [Nitrososphaerales archaeon]